MRSIIDRCKGSAVHSIIRAVPAKILEVGDIPRTKSGKIVEIPVRYIIHGREVKNMEPVISGHRSAVFGCSHCPIIGLIGVEK